MGKALPELPAALRARLATAGDSQRSADIESSAPNPPLVAATRTYLIPAAILDTNSAQ